MMMMMLQVGGMSVLTDNIRQADDDNPRGYYELERVKEIEHDKGWLPLAEGKVVKMVSVLLRHLPDDHDYKVIFMRRKMGEILASQRRMLIRRGEDPDAVSDEKIAEVSRKHLQQVEKWLSEQRCWPRRPLAPPPSSTNHWPGSTPGSGLIPQRARAHTHHHGEHHEHHRTVLCPYT